MNIFYRPFYTSEATQFIEQLKQERPQLEASQREGRELLWDKPVDREAWRAYRAARWRSSPTFIRTLGTSNQVALQPFRVSAFCFYFDRI